MSSLARPFLWRNVKLDANYASPNYDNFMRTLEEHSGLSSMARELFARSLMPPSSYRVKIRFWTKSIVMGRQRNRGSEIMTNGSVIAKTRSNPFVKPPFPPPEALLVFATMKRVFMLS
jgi:hypothetical protein